MIGLATDMKTCSKCKKIKPLSEFNKDKHQSGGYKYACRECTKKDFKAYYVKNEEAMRERALQYRNNNLEKRKQYEKEYIKNNRGKKNLWTRTREANKNKRTPKWLTKDQLKQMQTEYELAAWCTKVTGISYHVDHIVPLQGANVSGLHVPWNLQVITATDNSSKGNRYNG